MNDSFKKILSAVILGIVIMIVMKFILHIDLFPTYYYVYVTPNHGESLYEITYPYEDRDTTEVIKSNDKISSVKRATDKIKIKVISGSSIKVQKNKEILVNQQIEYSRDYWSFGYY